MTAAADRDLLTDLYRRGIRLRLNEGRIDVLAPAGSLTSDLRDQLERRRDGLITLLRQSETAASNVITPRPKERHEPFPLTDIQHAYLVGRSPGVVLGGVATHFYFELEREGLDSQRLTDSLRLVIARHDMLRAVIQGDGRQRILPEAPAYQIPVADLRELPEPEREVRLAAIRAELSHQVLPAGRWPMFDIRVSRLGPRRLRLHVSLDLLIVDAYSIYLLFRDWRRFYEQPGWRPEPLRLSYRDYVLAITAQHGGPRFRRAEEYWLSRLDDLPPAPALATATYSGGLDRTSFTRRRAALPRGPWEAVKQRAARRGLTPSVVLLTAFCDVLLTWSHQSACTLNLTLFSRDAIHPEIDQIVGDFTAVTLLAVWTRPGDDFATRAAHLHRQLLQDLEHLSYSGVRIMRELARRVGGGPAALMPVVFTSALGLPGGASLAEDMAFFGEFGNGISQTPQVSLDHQVMEEGGELVFNWDAVELLFPAGLLDDMFAAYLALLHELSEDEAAWDTAGRRLPLPSWQEAERAAVNDTAEAIPAATLSGLVQAQISLRPEATAVIADDGRLSYRELGGLAGKLSQRLAGLGVSAGTLIGVVLEKGRDQVAAVLGIAGSGAAYLPVEPGWPRARQQQILAQGQVRVLVTSPRLRDELSWPDGISVITLADDEAEDAGPLPPGPSPDDLAYVIFTSGSTGQPKGVMIRHRAVANTIQDINKRFGVGPGDRVLAVSALSFDLSVYDIFGILAAGGTVILPSPVLARDPGHWTELADRHGVTIWNSVPALMRAWLDDPGQASATSGDIRLVLLSGDWIPVTMPGQVRARYPEAQVISLGGATEASIWSVYYPIGDVPPDWTAIPYGRPLANQVLHVYDGRLDPCPVWVTGEICIGGTGLASGYWADQERTSERFVRHPVSGEPLYRTGDLGRYLPGGDIEFLGRADSQVKLHGYRVELGEIAAVLRRQRGVRDALVSLEANPATGARQLVAYVIPAVHGQPEAGPVIQAGPAGHWAAATEAGLAESRLAAAELAGELGAFQRLWRAMEELCQPVMARTLARLGVFTKAGESATASEIVAAGGITERYLSLTAQWLSSLAQAGVLDPVDAAGRYRCRHALDQGELDQKVTGGLAALAALAPGGYLRILAGYIAQCANSQIELLRGQVSPLELLFPSGSWEVAEVLYAANPVNGVHNRVAARVVASAVGAIQADRTTEILEVGGGTGATSAGILAALPPGRARYRFTDVSTFFTDRASRLVSAWPFAERGIYDIDREPASQGIGPGSVDIIVAANVLHDAADLATSLRYLRSTLVAGGGLVLIEGTVNSPIQMITVGFIEGLSRTRDDRQLPLLSVSAWQERLEAAGFWPVTVIPASPGDVMPDALTQHVIVAQAPGGMPVPDPAALRAALAELLPDYMVPHHYLLIDQLPLSANGKVDVAALPSPWQDPGVQRVVPRSATERRLFEIWRDALGHGDFGVMDNFFELGGDSLHAVRILTELRAEFGLDWSADEGLERLFDNPTIEELARALGAGPGAAE